MSLEFLRSYSNAPSPVQPGGLSRRARISDPGTYERVLDETGLGGGEMGSIAEGGERGERKAAAVGGAAPGPAPGWEGRREGGRGRGRGRGAGCEGPGPAAGSGPGAPASSLVPGPQALVRRPGPGAWAQDLMESNISVLFTIWPGAVGSFLAHYLAHLLRQMLPLF